jgi:hypothetical protein
MMCSRIDDFIKNLDEDLKNSTEFDMHDNYQALTLDTICTLGMGLNHGVQKNFKKSEVLRRVRAIVNAPMNILLVLGRKGGRIPSSRRFPTISRPLEAMRDDETEFGRKSGSLYTT